MDAVIRLALGALLALATLPLAPAAGAQAPEATRTARSDRRSTEDWRSPESWRRLRLGMTQPQVARILGEPGKVTRYYAFTRWEYPDALGRRVNFDERGRLLAWGALAR